MGRVSLLELQLQELATEELLELLLIVQPLTVNLDLFLWVFEDYSLDIPLVALVVRVHPSRFYMHPSLDYNLTYSKIIS